MALIQVMVIINNNNIIIIITIIILAAMWYSILMWTICCLCVRVSSTVSSKYNGIPSCWENQNFGRRSNFGTLLMYIMSNEFRLNMSLLDYFITIKDTPPEEVTWQWTNINHLKMHLQLITVIVQLAMFVFWYTELNIQWWQFPMQ